MSASEAGPIEDVKIVALLSCPMVGWNPHWGTVSEALKPFQIPIRLFYGAYWHQGMSNLMEDCLDDGVDWILTLDYDTMADLIDLDRLLGRFGQSPEIDALAALQCKRGTEDAPLMTMTGIEEIEITGQAVKADTAHFGMTLFRTEALRRMPMPWFDGRPDANGSYRSLKRVDPDIAFWHNWKKAGNSLYVDPMVTIGHLQPMVAEYDDNFKVRYVHVTEWRARHLARRETMGVG